MNAKGTFDVTMNAEPPWDVIDGVALARATFHKVFHGPLDARGVVTMLSARTPRDDSAAYVALERVTGTLAGRTGTFVLQHGAVLDQGARSLVVAVVPDSATGALRGLNGRMEIEIVEGQHRYDFSYDLPSG